ncbi:MAG: S-layer homology domain-containing protein [Clostridia bacterium]|nr:S-layer homology domain-containing protein [Clostridia bacterium]
MKRAICMLLSVLVLLSFPVFADDKNPWEAEFGRVISENKEKNTTKYILADIDFDNVPELFAGDDGKSSVYTYKNSSVMKVWESQDFGIGYFENIKTVRNSDKNYSCFMGQAVDNGKVITYELGFSDCVPYFTVIFRVNEDLGGTFYENGQEVYYENCQEKVLEYLSEFSAKPYTVSVLTAKEIGSAKEEDAIYSLFRRYELSSGLSDDTASFSADVRDRFKKLVGAGDFLAFDKISRLNETDIYVQFYVTDKNSAFVFPYEKRYAVLSEVSGKFSIADFYGHESEINTERLFSLKTNENHASNVYIDYGKTASFRGIDDYITYLSRIFSEYKNINENGKKTIVEFMEYAVNKYSKTGVKAKNNIVFIGEKSVSIVAENAALSMGRFEKLCTSNGFETGRVCRIIPEIVCSEVDLSLPLRIDFEKGLSETLKNVSGIRVMLNESHGIYITKDDLAKNEDAYGAFSIEYRHGHGNFSVVFTDGENKAVGKTVSPVWFIAPAESEYSTVLASFEDGTDNWGGQFDPVNKTIEFSTNYSGNYEILENDLTINDIDTLTVEEARAIRFLVSKGIFVLDKKNNFMPNEKLTRYEFLSAVVKMFYATNNEATTSYTDVPKSSPYYKYVASAEAAGLTTSVLGKKLKGNTAVKKESVVALCGHVLAQNKNYILPENYDGLKGFSDADKISEEVRESIKNAIFGGLIEPSESFSPDEKLTRKSGALLLYKTFMLMYDVSPVTTVSSENAQEIGQEIENVQIFDTEFYAAICILAAVVLIFVVYILIKIRRAKNKKKKSEV